AQAQARTLKPLTGDDMRPITSSIGLSRRVLLSTLAMLPMLSASLRPAQAQSDPLPSWNDGATKNAITDFVARITTQGGPLRAAGRARCHLRQRRHAVVRTADVRPARVRARPGEGARA